MPHVRLANREIWEPVFAHGPSISFAHSENDVEVYLSALDEWLDLGDKAVDGVSD